MSSSDTRTEISSSKDWPDPHGRCKIVETITKTFGMVEDTDQNGLVWLVFVGACVTGGGFVWNEAGTPALNLSLVGKVGHETHTFKLDLPKGCEDLSCHIGGLAIAEGGLSAYVEGSGTQAQAGVTISLPDNDAIPVEVDVSPKIPAEHEDQTSITVHGTLKGSGSATAAGPVGPGVGTGTAGGSGSVDFKWTWRKKGPNKESDDLSVQIEVQKDCKPTPVLRASTNAHVDLSADTWWPRGCGARISFEHVTIETSCEIECECTHAARTVKPRGEFAAVRSSSGDRQQLAMLEGRRRELLRAQGGLTAQREKLAALAGTHRAEAAVHGALTDQVERMAQSVITEAQWDELDRLRARLAAESTEALERQADFTAVEVTLARIEAHLTLIDTAEKAMADGYRFSAEQLTALLAPSDELRRRS